MARYSLHLPLSLKIEAEAWAEKQKVSLNSFIISAVMEKLAVLNQRLNDPDFPEISYQKGAGGIPSPVVLGTGVRVQTIMIANQQWEMDADQIASEYNLDPKSVNQALDFYQAHREEIDRDIAAENR